MSLCGLFVFVVVFFVEGKWGVIGDGVPQIVFCKSKCAHGFFVVVECGAEVGTVPLAVLGCSADMWGGPKGFLHFFRFLCELEPSLGVVFPDCCSQHRRFCVRVECSCFHCCMKVFEVVELLHFAPYPRPRRELGLCFAFVLQCLMRRVCELCHKEECWEYEYVVDANG